MSVRINTNASAINTHRHVVNNAKVQERNLEKLASGMKVNRGVDGPAHIQIGEQIRSQTASLKQAIDNTEMSVSLMQTAEAALDEVSRALINARQIATHAANTGTNSEFMFEADQLEIDNIVQQINTIAANTQYGKNFLLEQKVFPILGIGSDGIDLLNNVVNFQLICFEHELGIGSSVGCMSCDLSCID